MYRQIPAQSRFFMNKFRKLGYVGYNGELEILSSLLAARY
jgi:hypothetical protein